MEHRLQARRLGRHPAHADAPSRAEARRARRRGPRRPARPEVDARHAGESSRAVTNSSTVTPSTGGADLAQGGVEVDRAPRAGREGEGVAPAVALKVGAHAVDVALRHETSLVDDDHRLADRLDLLEDVRREEHRVLPAQPSNHLAKAQDLVGVEPLGGLIEDEQGGRGDQRVGEAHALPKALGEVADEPTAHLGDVRELHRAILRAAPLATRDPFDLRAKPQVLLDPHLGVQGHGLGHVPDALSRIEAVLHHVVPVHRGGALGGREVGREHLERGALARAVGAEEAHHLAAGHGEGERLHRGAGAEASGEVFGLDHGRECGGSAGAMGVSSGPLGGVQFCAGIQGLRRTGGADDFVVKKGP